MEKEGFTLLLEPLNTYVDHPGYFLNSAKEGARIIRDINHPHIHLLYDVYHMQIMEGNVISTIEQNIDIIGHFHAAGVPGRGELYIGELNYPNIIKRIEGLGYEGCFGLEYFPSMDSEESLKSIKELLED
ncbi:2-oxo-tetronate isomerase [subsurface metagenome]